MAKQLTFNIPDDKYDRFIAAWSVNYQDQILDPDGSGTLPNPQTRAQFAKEQIRDMLHSQVRNYESTQVMDIGIT